MKTVRKSKNAALVWKEAPAAKGGSYIVPTFERNVFNGYLVSRLDDCDTRYLCGGTRKLGQAKAIPQGDHGAGKGSVGQLIEKSFGERVGFHFP